MLLRQHPRRQRIRRIARQHRYHRLREDGAMVKFVGDAVDCGPGELAARVDGALVRVQAREGGQQGRVDVDEASIKALHKSWRQDAHEARQHHLRGLIAVNHVGQHCVKGVAAGKGFVVDHLGGNALRLGECQSPRIGPVADHRSYFYTPATALRRPYDGRHVGAAARNQDDDVIHSEVIIRLHFVRLCRYD